MHQYFVSLFWVSEANQAFIQSEILLSRDILLSNTVTELKFNTGNISRLSKRYMEVQSLVDNAIRNFFAIKSFQECQEHR